MIVLVKEGLETAEIISAIKSNNSRALVQYLYKTAYPPIKSYIRQKGGDVHEAEDCFQDALLNLIKVVSKDELNEQYEVKNYLFVTARNIWFNKIKRMGKVNAYEFLEELNPSDFETPELKVISDERKIAITTLMNKLGETCKQLLTYTMFEKRKLKEVAVLMNFSSDEVAKTNNYRCKKKMKEMFSENLELKNALLS